MDIYKCPYSKTYKYFSKKVVIDKFTLLCFMTYYRLNIKNS